MKLKISILLTILFSISLTAFGQKETIKPKTGTKPTDTKTTPTTQTKTTDSQTAAVKMPTAREILARYVQAIGGRAANEKIKTRMAKGTLEIAPNGIKGTFENYSAAPNKSVARVTLAGIGELVDGFDGTTAWTINPIQGNRDKSGEELAQTKLSYNFHREINFDKFYPKMELRGIEKVGADDAYVIVATPDNLPAETFYFDTKSGLLLRQDSISVTPEGRTPGKTFLEDYREIDGIKIPFKTRTVLPQFELISIFTEVKQNVAVEDSKFIKPKS